MLVWGAYRCDPAEDILLGLALTPKLAQGFCEAEYREQYGNAEPIRLVWVGDTARPTTHPDDPAWYMLSEMELKTKEAEE